MLADNVQPANAFNVEFDVTVTFIPLSTVSYLTSAVGFVVVVGVSGVVVFSFTVIVQEVFCALISCWLFDADMFFNVTVVLPTVAVDFTFKFISKTSELLFTNSAFVVTNFPLFALYVIASHLFNALISLLLTVSNMLLSYSRFPSNAFKPFPASMLFTETTTLTVPPFSTSVVLGVNVTPKLNACTVVTKVASISIVIIKVTNVFFIFISPINLFYLQVQVSL